MGAARKTKKKVAEPETRVPDPITRVEVEGARMLVTVGPDHPIFWAPNLGEMAARAKEDPELLGFDLLRFSGAIVRVYPPESATGEQVELVGRMLANLGAGAVRVQPRRRSGTVTSRPPFRKREAHKRAREVVLEMVAEANTEDRETLRAFCEGVMAQVRL